MLGAALHYGLVVNGIDRNSTQYQIELGGIEARGLSRSPKDLVGPRRVLGSAHCIALKASVPRFVPKLNMDGVEYRGPGRDLALGHANGAIGRRSGAGEIIDKIGDF